MMWCVFEPSFSFASCIDQIISVSIMTLIVYEVELYLSTGRVSSHLRTDFRKVSRKSAIRDLELSSKCFVMQSNIRMKLGY